MKFPLLPESRNWTGKLHLAELVLSEDAHFLFILRSAARFAAFPTSVYFHYILDGTVHIKEQ